MRSQYQNVKSYIFISQEMVVNIQVKFVPLYDLLVIGRETIYFTLQPHQVEHIRLSDITYISSSTSFTVMFY